MTKNTQPVISQFFSSQRTKEIEEIGSRSTEQRAKNTTPPVASFAFDRYATRDELPPPEKKSAIRTSFENALMEKPKRQTDNILEGTMKKPKKSFDALTPLEQQYISLKKAHLDKVLAIQVGYKYKFFGEDAARVHKLLNIMLIPGKVTLDPTNAADQMYDRIAYCSIPENRLHIHLKRILDAGLKVGVVEQIEAAAIKAQSTNKSGLFGREMTKVYTTGTYIDTGDIDSIYERSGNYIVALMESKASLHILAVQLTSGQIVYDSFKDDIPRNDLETRLLHLSAAEILMVDELAPETETCLKNYTLDKKSKIRMVRANSREYRTYVTEMTHFFEDIQVIMSLNKEVQILVFEMILYLKEFDLQAVFNRTENYECFSSKKYMILNNHTLKSLEIFENSTNGEERGSLLGLLDHTRTKYGFRMLKNWIARPLIAKEDIIERQDSIDSILLHFDHRVIEMFTHFLKGSTDLERSLNRIHFGRCSMQEIYLILQNVNGLLELFDRFNMEEISTFSQSLKEEFAELKSLSEKLSGFSSYLGMLNSATIKDEYLDSRQLKLNYFSSRFFNYEELDAERENISNIEALLDEELQKIRALLRRPQLQFTKNNKESYLIEIRNSDVGKIPSDWLKFNGTKTLSRYYTPQVKRLLDRIRYHEERVIERTEENFKLFLLEIDSHYSNLNKMIKILAKLDVLFSLASLSTGYTKPRVVDYPFLDLKDSRNPVLEMINAGRPLIANDIKMSKDDSRILVITGPNMGGKSSTIKQVALLVIMTQMGCYIPARMATVGIFSQIFIRMGSSDNIIKGESTFQLEMLECWKILNQKDNNSLILLDEIGRGTSTSDGFAVAYSILDYLATETESFVLFITHFNKLNKFETTYPMVKNYHMEYLINGNILTFLYKFIRGFCSKSYGINVARLTSIPEEIINQSEQISKNYEIELENKTTVNWSLKARNVLKNLESANANTSVRQLNDLMDHIF